MTAVAAAAAIPGPRLKAIGGLRYFSGWFPFLEDCRSRYGDVFKLHLPFWGEVVVLADPAAVRAVYVDKDATVTRPARTEAVRGLFEGEPLVFLDGPEHLHRRKLLLPHFHGEELAHHEELIRDVIRGHAEQLVAGQRLQMSKFAPAVTIDIIGRVLLGLSQPGTVIRFRELVRRLMPAWTATVALPASLRTERIPGPWRRFARIRRELRDLMLNEIARHRADSSADRTICSLLMTARDEHDRTMTDAEIYSELVELTIGGSHTTAIALAWTLDHLLHDESTRDRLESAPDERTLLDAVIWETLRISTVIDSGPRVLARDMQLAGMLLARGTVVYPSAHLVHRRADLYDQPDRFLPDRFLGRPPGTFGWLPFGGGAHRCIGPAMAQLELRVIVCELLRRWRLRPTSPKVSRPRRSTLFWVPAGGVELSVHAR